jgi:hypothetical protein
MLIPSSSTRSCHELSHEEHHNSTYRVLIEKVIVKIRAIVEKYKCKYIAVFDYEHLYLLLNDNEGGEELTLRSVIKGPADARIGLLALLGHALKRVEVNVLETA